MESSGILSFVVALLVGGVAGYFIARYVGRNDDRDAKLAALQSEYDDYRERVRNHFIDTVATIGKIDEQQRLLYQSVAEGVTELCQQEQGEDDYFVEQTMHTLGKLESPEKNKDDKLN